MVEIVFKWATFFIKHGKVTGDVHFQQIFRLARTYHRNSHQRSSLKKAFLKNFAKFTGTHQSKSLFLKHFFHRTPLRDFRYQNCDFQKIVIEDINMWVRVWVGGLRPLNPPTSHPHECYVHVLNQLGTRAYTPYCYTVDRICWNCYNELQIGWKNGK